ncbi:uncharacterized protein LOC111693009, partial [Anoplophora glabripennis]|uniref:uncharacterized protein LOC111693009 n=1 Tax=Anoplophora glabripennis TaxID=217634 RepID=UPI000C78328E
VKKEHPICLVKGKICLEHKVRSKAYCVTLEVEGEDKVIDIKCHDCAAAAGGCKHALAFLMWVHRRSEDPAPTEIASYWQKPRMASIGSTTKFVAASQFWSAKSSVAVTTYPNNQLFFNDLIEKAKSEQIYSQISKYNFEIEADQFNRLSIHKLLLMFKNNGGVHYRDFVQFMSSEMNDNVVKIAEDATKGQRKSSLWYELRYGRITASKIYEAGNCKTSDGTLVETIIGAHKIRETRAMKRGIKLEKEVLRRVEEELKIKLKPCGIILKREYPIFGASPDAIADDFVVEIKCPSSVKALSNYIKDGLIVNKYKAQ